MTDKILLRVFKGCLKPADQYAEEALRGRGYKLGDILTAALRKPRNPAYHRYIFGPFAKTLIKNIDIFKLKSSREVLKFLQFKGDIGCEYLEFGGETLKLVGSLSYESMDQVEFKRVTKALSEVVIEHYWPDLTSEKIQEMVGLMPD